jgi:uncharacterized YigZ family protein
LKDDEHPDRYMRPSAFFEYEERIQKSRFIAQVFPFQEPEDLEKILVPLRKDHYKANHHCHAWKVGHPALSPRFHYSDDGEPSGTAGAPMHRAIDASALSDVLVVVIRYFGGIKLGTGGLARAYGGCALSALKGVPTEECVRRLEISLRFPYSFLSAVKRLARSHEALEAKAVMSEDVHLVLAVPESKALTLRASLESLLMGRGRFLESQ